MHMYISVYSATMKNAAEIQRENAEKWKKCTHRSRHQITQITRIKEKEQRKKWKAFYEKYIYDVS